MAKSNNAKTPKLEAANKKKKGRPKKKTSKLNSPTKMIEKKERKRGRPPKASLQKKSDLSQLPLISDMHMDKVFLKERQDDSFDPRQNFAEPVHHRKHKLNEEYLENFEALRDIQDNQVQTSILTRRSKRLRQEDDFGKLGGIYKRFEHLEQMMSALGMMVFALHKKTVNKDKKGIIDDFIRKGFNYQTAKVIETNLLRDVNYFEKTRKNSVHLNFEGSMISAQGSIKQ